MTGEILRNEDTVSLAVRTLDADFGSSKSGRIAEESQKVRGFRNPKVDQTLLYKGYRVKDQLGSKARVSTITTKSTESRIESLKRSHRIDESRIPVQNLDILRRIDLFHFKAGKYRDQRISTNRIPR